MEAITRTKTAAMFVFLAMLASALVFAGGALASGGGNSDNAFYFFNGNMDEIRITKGLARYASDSGYTVATQSFPRS